MPQMAPMNWLTLMITFIMIFTLFNILNFYSFKYPNKSIIKKNINNFNQNWKW